MNIPTVHAIRESLSNIEGALIDEPWPTTVDVGDVPHVPISHPTGEKNGERATPADFVGEPIEEGPSVIFEIPPGVDDRIVREMLSAHGGRDFERLTQAHGIDALGWYFPFHYRMLQHAIYISSAGALWLAIRVFRRNYSEDAHENLAKKLQHATHAILRHESFHFAAECMAANWELVTGAPCYVSAAKKLRSSAGYVEEEEALANAYMLRGFRWVSSATAGARATPSLKKFTKAGPPGYNRGVDYVRSDRYESGCRKLAFQYHDSMDLGWFAPRHSFDSLGLYPNANRIDWRRCPVILVDEGRLFSMLGILPRFIDCIAQLTETETFKRQLDKLGTTYVKKWTQTKIKLSTSTRTRSLDFKPWPPRGKGWYSVRVDDGVRAHLRNEGARFQWHAEEIGRHDAMGH